MIMPHATAPQVSIVIVSFNTRELLRECIQSLQRQAGGIQHETIVVDNASRDGSADMVESGFPEVRLIRSETNLGFAAANNLAFAVARGRYVVLLNSDAFLEPGALRISITHMENNPTVGLRGARLVGRDGSWQPAARMFPSPLNELLMMSGLAAHYPHSHFFGRADRTWADPGEAAPSTGCPALTASFARMYSIEWDISTKGSFSITRRSICAAGSRRRDTRCGTGLTS